MKVIKYGVVLSIAFLASCGSAQLASPTTSDVERVSAANPDLTLAELTKGYELYSANCNKCHGLEDPKAYTEEEWRRLVPAMVPKANRKGSTLTPSDENLILQYVLAMGPHAR